MASENRILKFINESRDKLIKVLLPSIIGYMIISVFIIVSFSYGKGYSENQELFIISTLAILFVAIFGILFFIYYLNSTSFISNEIMEKINKQIVSYEDYVRNTYNAINNSSTNISTLTTELNTKYDNVKSHLDSVKTDTNNIKGEYENVKNLSNSFKTDIEKSLNEIKDVVNEIKKIKTDDNNNKAKT